ncbi:MAG: LppX_LprAFG lipoprotein [Dehalococcoidia bacterium]
MIEDWTPIHRGDPAPMASAGKLTSSIVLLLALGIACGSDPTPTAIPEENPLTAKEILGLAAEGFESLLYFHFEMTHEGGGTPIALGLEMDQVEGDIAAPDRMKATIQAQVRGLFLEVSAITIGDDTYITNPFTGQYEKLTSGITGGGFFDPAEGISAIIREAIGPTLLPDDTLEGTPVYHLAATVRSEDLRSISPGATEGFLLGAEIWIGKEDFLIRKLVLDGRITQDEKESITRTILVSGFDEPVTIEAPVIADEP